MVVVVVVGSKVVVVVGGTVVVVDGGLVVVVDGGLAGVVGGDVGVVGAVVASVCVVLTGCPVVLVVGAGRPGRSAGLAAATVAVVVVETEGVKTDMPDSGSPAGCVD